MMSTGLAPLFQKIFAWFHDFYHLTTNFLDSIILNQGEQKISLLTVVQALVLLVVFIWISQKLISYLDRVISGRTDKCAVNNPTSNTSSLKILFIKVLRTVTIAGAILITLNIVGVNLTAVTLFGGAIGVGLGFGLQKIVSNFISGIIILVDRSIKPGDVIEIEGVYGWISSITLRFVSIVTREGKEFLIPNEDFITHKVVNWSYSDRLVRVKADLKVSYRADLEEAIDLVCDAAESIDRIVSDPSPSCLVMGFGESSIQLELRFWIQDPQNGIANVTSEAYIAVWKSLKENNVEIPYPQQDIHVRSIQKKTKSRPDFMEQ